MCTQVRTRVTAGTVVTGPGHAWSAWEQRRLGQCLVLAEARGEATHPRPPSGPPNPGAHFPSSARYFRSQEPLEPGRRGLGAER